MHLIPITRRQPCGLDTPGFYLQEVGHDFELAGSPHYLGHDLVAGLGKFTAIDEGYYAILLKYVGNPPTEWGTLSVWRPSKDGRERWRLRSRGGRPVAVPGHVVWSNMLPASIEKGGASCAVQG